jgi:Uma2 family endonuclease
VTSFDVYSQHDDALQCEWVNGNVTQLPALSDEQRRLRDVLTDLIASYAEASELGLLITAPFPVRMPEEMRQAREPDLLFVPNMFVETIQERYVNSHGVTLAIEICDSRTRADDYGVRLQAYQAAGIPEYWICDTERRIVDTFALSQSVYRAVPPEADGQLATQSVPGLRFHPNLLWPE